jgi:hypothetical protein
MIKLDPQAAAFAEFFSRLAAAPENNAAKPASAEIFFPAAAAAAGKILAIHCRKSIRYMLQLLMLNYSHTRRLSTLPELD